MYLNEPFTEAPYRALIEEASLLLRKAYDEEREAAIDARLLLEHVCGTTLQTFLLEPDRTVSAGDVQLYHELVRRRAGREPLAYIVGTAGFMGLTFEVNSDVLIPEQDTENLIEEIMKETSDGERILDLCTGSGCILLSLVNYSNNSTGVGTDISPKALAVACANAERLGLSGRVEWRQGDLFDALGSGEQFDLIASNPPYIRSRVIESLAPEVKDHEPCLALDGGEDGLYFYRKIIPGALRHLVRGGMLFLEIGYDQGEAVLSMMREAGYYDVTVIKDYGGNDRVVRGIKSFTAQ